MEQVYWLSREQVSLKAAQVARSSEARLIHYDLAGRYSVKARAAETRAIDLGGSLPHDSCARPADCPTKETWYA